jgi:hypothetical protein
MDDVLSEMARSKIREVRTGLEAILQLLSRDAGRPPELQLVAPSGRSKSPAAKRRRAS